MISVNVTISDVKFSKKKWLDKIATKQRTASVPILKGLFRQTVYGWSQKPDFGWMQTKTAGEITIIVYPRGEYSDIWNLLNAGSPPHVIQAKNAKSLAFRTGYKSATKPGTLQSGRKYRSGPTVYTQKVNHPGFQARNFVTLIQEEYDKSFASDIQDAINDAASKM